MTGPRPLLLRRRGLRGRGGAGPGRSAPARPPASLLGLVVRGGDAAAARRDVSAELGGAEEEPGGGGGLAGRGRGAGAGSRAEARREVAVGAHRPRAVKRLSEKLTTAEKRGRMSAKRDER